MIRNQSPNLIIWKIILESTSIKIWSSVSTPFVQFLSFYSVQFLLLSRQQDFQKCQSKWSLLLNLECHNSFIINIYYMLTYEVNSMSKVLEDLTTYTCFRAPQRAIRTPPLKMHFCAFLTNVNSKVKCFQWKLIIKMAYLGGRLQGVQISVWLLFLLVSYLSPNLEKSCLQLTESFFGQFSAKFKV